MTARKQAEELVRRWLKTTSGLHRAALYTHISVPTLIDYITEALESRDQQVQAKLDMPSR